MEWIGELVWMDMTEFAAPKVVPNIWDVSIAVRPPIIRIGS